MKWRFICCFFVFTNVLVCCGVKHSTVKDYVKNADSASIAFYNQINQSNATQIVVKDKVTISKLGNYIDGKVIEPQKCGENGSIWFYEGGKKKMQVDFSLNGECNSFTYMMNDELYSKSMSEDANKYLNSVKVIASESL